MPHSLHLRRFQIAAVAACLAAASLTASGQAPSRPAAPAAPAAPAPPPPATPQMEARVNALLAKMTTAEKLDLVGGVDGFFVRGVPRLGLPPLKMADGPIGVRNWGPADAMPAGIGLAATFDPALAATIGRRDRARRPRQGRALSPGPGRGHLYGPDERPQLRVLRRRPVPGGANRRGLHQRRPERGRERHREALRRQQLGVRPPQRERDRRRAHAARAVPAGVRGRGQGRPRRRGDGLLQPRERRARHPERTPEPRHLETRLGLQRRADVRLVCHLRRRGRRRRGTRPGDAVGPIHEPEDPPAGARPGQAVNEHHRRQGPAHPAHRGPVRLARPRPDRPVDPPRQPGRTAGGARRGA